jgi:hypothetical protein
MLRIRKTGNSSRSGCRKPAVSFIGLAKTSYTAGTLCVYWNTIIKSLAWIKNIFGEDRNG